jgi:hypothetical protein
MQVMSMTQPPQVIPFPAPHRYWRIGQLAAEPFWPWSAMTTRRMIWDGSLKCVRRGPGRGCILIPHSEVLRVLSLSRLDEL